MPQKSTAYIHRLISQLICILLLVACGTHRVENQVRPNEVFEEMPLGLGMIKSAQDRIGQDNRVLFAVAISGGGHRAGNFGAGGLIGLEEIETDNLMGQNALSQVDMLSTVSGGGFAAGIYISSLHDFMNYGSNYKEYSLKNVLSGLNPQNRYDPKALRQLERGYEDDIIFGFNPFAASFWKIVFGSMNRKDLLERAIDNDLLGAKWRKEKENGENISDFSLKLKDIFIPSTSDNTAPVLLPYWIANATVFENGEIFPFTPEHIKRYKICGYTHRLEPIRYPLNDLSSPGYDNFIFDMPLSVAATASGNFPVALPATTLESKLDLKNQYLHLLDGGLSDNLGVITAIRFLKQHDSAEIKKKILLVIDAYKGTLGPFSTTQRAPSIGDTAGRITSIYLDSWRGRYREYTRSILQADKIETIFISFEDLNKHTDFERLKKMGSDSPDSLRITDQDLAALIKKYKKSKTYQQHPVQPSPLDLLRDVPTFYNVTPEAQKFLISAGRLIVRDNKQKIIDALSLATKQ